MYTLTYTNDYFGNILNDYFTCKGYCYGIKMINKSLITYIIHIPIEFVRRHNLCYSYIASFKKLVIVT